MNRGVEQTLGLLTDTANEAAVPVLVAALDSQDRAVQDGALTAILGRRRGSGSRELVKRWGSAKRAVEATDCRAPSADLHGGARRDTQPRW